MEDLSQRKPPQLAIKAEDTSPTGENGALVWSTNEGRLITYNQNAGRWGVVGAYPALASVRIPAVTYYTFVEPISFTTFSSPLNQQYFIPFYTTEDRSITTMGYEVFTAGSGTADVGIYNSQVVNGISMPYQLLTSATALTATSGIHTATLSPSITLRAGILYWASILIKTTADLRAYTALTRMMYVAGPLQPLIAIYIINNSGNLVNIAPSTPSSYTGTSSAPHLIYN
jgi:hypothetical protein